MKLSYKDIEIEITFRNLSGAVNKAFYKWYPIIPNNEIKLQKLTLKCFPLLTDKDINELSDVQQAQKAVALGLQKGIISSEEYADLMPKELSYEEQIAIDNAYFEIFKATIDTRNLTAEQSDLIDSNVDSDFWQSQNFELIKNEVARFRQFTKR